MRNIKLQKNNLREALDLVWSTFQEFEAPEYPKEGIEEFKNFISYNSIIEKFDNKEIEFWGCIDNTKLVGVIATKEINHICLLFVDKKYHKRGIAKSLFKIVKDTCSNNNLNKITVNSSPYAADFYRKIGFLDISEEQISNGIRFIPMTYLL